MKILETAAEMNAFSANAMAKGYNIAFVPTMGALHEGHLSLVEQGKRENHLVVVSVFVNPTQFNNPKDLEKYPRTFEQDRKMLLEVGVDAMFYPSVNEVYPTEAKSTYDLDGLDNYMEGPNRPGHFNGVVQVVTRLFDLVQPTKALFGEKDFQQLAIMKHMSRKLGYNVEIVGCPTIREESGLAKSSRNVRLSTKGEQTAANIYRVLNDLKQSLKGGLPTSKARQKAIEELNKTAGLDLEYFELVDPESLKPCNDDSEHIQGCVAAYVESVRLIDNMRLK